MNKNNLLNIYKTHFVFVLKNKQMAYLLKDFIFKFNTYTYVYDKRKKKLKRAIDKTFIGGNLSIGEYRFPINALESFIWYLRSKNFKSSSITVVNESMHSFRGFKNIKLNPKFKPRNNQQKYIDDLVGFRNNPFKLINLYTGGGKTFIASASLCKLGKATAIIILPKYIEKWKEDLEKNTDIKSTDYCVVRGRDQLDTLIELAKDGELTAKIIIFSNRTLAMYFKEYEEKEYIDEFVDSVNPSELMPLLGIGNILIDEVHQEFYTVFKCAIYFNVENFIGLSATMENKDPYKMKMYNMLFNKEAMIKHDDIKKYIDTYPVEYRFRVPDRINAKSPMMGYSHIEFEKSIMRNPQTLRNYLKLIETYVEESYIVDRKKGDKLAVYAASIKLCTIITNYLSDVYDDLDVRRYVEDDPYENCIDADIRVTTILGAGTAVDIPGLTAVIQTVNTLSIQSNKQTIGRLREIKGRDVKFYYLYSPQIKKHLDYHIARKDIFSKITKTFILKSYFNFI